MPYQHRFNTIYESKSGGSVKVHAHYIPKETDKEIIKTIAHEKADKGHQVEILPEPHIKENANREALLQNYKYHPKNPDLRIDGHYIDIKQPKIPYGKDSISDIIRDGAKQADYIIIDLKEPIKEETLKQITDSKFNHPKGQLKHLMKIEFRMGGKYYLFERNQKR